MPMTIALTDERAFIEIMRTRYPFENSNEDEIVEFLREAGLTNTFIQNNILTGHRHNMAGKVFYVCTDHGFPIETRQRGYTTLGCIVDAYLERQLVGRANGVYISIFALHYELVIWRHARRNSKLIAFVREITEYMCTGIPGDSVESLYAAKSDTRRVPADLSDIMRRSTELLQAIPSARWEDLRWVLS